MHEQTHLLGGQKGAPLMLLPSAAAAEEACSLLLGSSSAGIAAPIRAAPPSPLSSSLLLDLGCWAEAACPSSPLLSSTIHSPAPRLLGLGLQLLCHSIRHCLPGCTSEILDIISTRLGIPPEELLHSVPMLEWVCGSIDPPSLSLLHMAMQAGHLPLIQSLINWAKLHSVRPDWTVAGPSGICPLHLAALLPNAEAVVRGMLELPRPYGPDIAAAWLLCRSSDGRTPAELGSSVGLPASLDTLAKDALVRAAEEEPNRFLTGEPRAAATAEARSVSVSSGISGVAAMIMDGGHRMTHEEVLPPQTRPASACVSRGCSSSGSSSRAEESEVAPSVRRLGAEDDDDPPPGSCWLDRWGGSVGGGGEFSSSCSNAGLRPKGAPTESLSRNTTAVVGMAVAAEPAAACPGNLHCLLLFGFPDSGTEARYVEFKVMMSGAGIR